MFGFFFNRLDYKVKRYIKYPLTGLSKAVHILFYFFHVRLKKNSRPHTNFFNADKQCIYISVSTTVLFQNNYRDRFLFSQKKQVAIIQDIRVELTAYFRQLNN